MTKFVLNYYGGYKIKLADNTLCIYAPPSTSDKSIDPKIPTNIVGYLMNEGFFEDIPNDNNINVITHEATL